MFGVAVSLIAVFEGYDAQPTAEGVSRATTRTVVASSLAILALDFVLTVFMFRGWQSGVSMNRSTHRPVGRHFRRRSASARSLFLALKVGNLDVGQQRAGLSPRGALRQHRRPQAARAGEGAGVVVGRVEQITLDPQDVPGASSRCSIDQGYQFTKDTIASILTSGLLGEVYIGLDAGGDTQMLADGGRIAQDAVGGGAREADRPVHVRQGAPTAPGDRAEGSAKRRSTGAAIAGGAK